MEKEKLKIFKSPAFTAPLLAAFVLASLSLSRYALLRQADTGESVFLVITIIQLAVFALPCVFYYLSKGRKLDTPIFASLIRPSHIVFTIFTLLLFISGIILIKYIYYISGAGTAELTFYFDSVADIGEEGGLIGIILSLVVVPAVCEEMFFRGVILSEYRGMGSVNAVIMSALCFSMLHFSAKNFPVYFFAGIVLGFSAVITRSLLTPILLHLAGNALSVFGSDRFLTVTVQKSGAFFVGFVLLMVFGLALLFVISNLEQIYYGYADNPPVTSVPPHSLPNALKVFLSPTFLLLIIVFLLTLLL